MLYSYSYSEWVGFVFVYQMGHELCFIGCEECGVVLFLLNKLRWMYWKSICHKQMKEFNYVFFLSDMMISCKINRTWCASLLLILYPPKDTK